VATPLPKVTFVIAAFNCAATIRHCFESLFLQSFQNWEAVVCDDHSDDGSWEQLCRISRAEPRIITLRNPRRLGAAATRNRCLEVAQGEYVAIQDADDVSAPHRLAVQVRHLDAHREVAFVSSGMFLYDERGTYGYHTPRVLVPNRTDFLRGLPFCHAATVFRRDVLNAVSGYRVARDTMRGHDYDLFMRLYAAGFVGHNLPDYLYGYQQGPGAYARRAVGHRINEAMVRYKGFRGLGLLPWGLPFVLKPVLVGLIPNALRKWAATRHRSAESAS
jgi:glycosyltransferase EpsE